MATVLGSTRHWQDIAEAKRKENMAQIPKEWLLQEQVVVEGNGRKKLVGDFIEGLLDPEILEITSLDTEDVLDLLQNGSLSALQVTRAFCKRGAYAHQLVRDLSFQSSRSY